MRFLLLFFVAAAEVWIVIGVARRIGVLAVVALLVVCMLGGLHLVRSQGLNLFKKIREEGAARIKDDVIAAETGLLMLAALLLIMPGFLTSILGLLLLIPFVRHFIAKHLPHNTGRMPFVRHVFFDVTRFGHHDGNANAYHEDEPRGVIQVEAKIVDPKDRKDEDA